MTVITFFHFSTVAAAPTVTTVQLFTIAISGPETHLMALKLPKWTVG